MARIYLSPPDVRELEKEFVVAAIDSGWVAPVGPDLDAFEREIAEASGVAYAVGLVSGTAALHLALTEAGVGPGDDVFVSTFTFVSTANAVAYLRATPVFIDSETSSWNMSPDLLSEELSERARRGKLPKACVVVDLYGQCADYERIRPVLNEYGVALVEDSAEALGASYGGRAAGSFGESAIVSFNGNKIITSSAGGMFLSNNADVADHVRYLATQARGPVPHYEHLEVGYNYRLSNILAAFGRGQLAGLSDRIARRRQIHDRYAEALAQEAGIELQPIAPYGQPNYWLTCITVDADVAGFDRERLRLRLEAVDVESRPLWKPMHLQPIYADAPARADGTSERLFDTGLCLPSGSGMTDTELDFVIEHVLRRDV